MAPRWGNRLAGMELLTFGHGTLSQERTSALLGGAGVEMLVDIRRAPGSRRHPHFGRSALEVWLPEGGISYRWEARLGGWRRPSRDSPNTGLRNDSFRGYADYMRTPEFWTALDDALADATDRRTAVMCSEAVYWRCHRRLVSDAAELQRAAQVLHLGHDGKLNRHRLTDGVRRDGDLLVYDSADGSGNQELLLQ